MIALRLWLEGRLPGLNEVTAKNRGSAGWVSGARQKKRVEAALVSQMTGCEKWPGRHDWFFTWRVKDKRRDPDNIASASKFIFDALQTAGVIVNDGWKQVGTLHHAFEIGEPEGVSVVAMESQTAVTMCYWRRVPESESAGDIIFNPACDESRLWLFNDASDLDTWQYCPFCGRPLSTATDGDDDDNAR